MAAVSEWRLRLTAGQLLQLRWDGLYMCSAIRKCDAAFARVGNFLALPYGEERDRESKQVITMLSELQIPEPSDDYASTSRLTLESS